MSFEPRLIALLMLTICTCELKGVDNVVQKPDSGPIPGRLKLYAGYVGLWARTRSSYWTRQNESVHRLCGGLWAITGASTNLQQNDMCKDRIVIAYQNKAADKAEWNCTLWLWALAETESPLGLYGNRWYSPLHNLATPSNSIHQL